MYTRMLIPLDGSKTAEKVLPYARTLASRLTIPVELLAVIDIAEMAHHISVERARHLDTLIEDTVRDSEAYLSAVAKTFAGANVKCTVERGKAEEVIIANAATDRNTVITMSTHGRSGIDRWLLGSVAEKVLRGTINPLLLIRASEEAKSDGEAPLKSVVVPLDGSELAERVLPTVTEIAKELNLEIVLFRAYHIPYSAYTGDDGYTVNINELVEGIREEAREYIEKKTQDLKKRGIERVSYVLKEGLSADEIILFGKQTSDNLIAMSTHGRSGVKRWVLGSVTETVVRHCGDPVLVIRAT